MFRTFLLTAVVPTLAAITIGGHGIAFGQVVVSTPSSGQSLTSPFTLQASSSTCATVPTVSMGYSLDSSTQTTTFKANTINASVSAPLGAHVLHVKCWGQSGAAGVSNVNINVVTPAPPPAAGSAITVTSPYAGETVSSSFALQASANTCGSVATSAMGYSLDHSTQTTTFTGDTINTTISASPGAHVLQVKCWGPGGAADSSNINISVSADLAPPPTVAMVTVGSPYSGANVDSTFRLQAGGSTNNSSDAITSMGYASDNSQMTTINGNSLDTMLSLPLGQHVLHVKSWSASGSVGTADVSINVTNGPAIPANATVVSNIQQLQSWKGIHDSGTQGSSAGSTQTNNITSLSGLAREFDMAYQNSGGQRFSTSIGADTAATHFVYDTQLYISGSAQGIANLEMDMNQVMANGQTVIYAFQCNGYSKTWDYTINGGTPTAYAVKWVHSTTACPAPKTWSTNTWHHVQIVYSRDDNGNVTYQEVWLDGVQYPLQNAIGNSAFALGWASTLVTNFQIDGLGASGSASAILDSLTVYRW